MTTTPLTFLIAHAPAQETKRDRVRVTQARIQAKTEAEATKLFKRLYPDRRITAVGILGEEG